MMIQRVREQKDYYDANLFVARLVNPENIRG